MHVKLVFTKFIPRCTASKILKKKKGFCCFLQPPPSQFFPRSSFNNRFSIDATPSDTGLLTWRWHTRVTYVCVQLRSSQIQLSFTMQPAQQSWHWRYKAPVAALPLSCWEATHWTLNTLRTGDADLRFYITAVQGGWRKSAILTRACFPCTIHLIMQYIEPVTEWFCWRMFIETWPHSELTFRHRSSSV